MSTPNRKKNRADVRRVAIKLNEIYSRSPANYFYLKGFIHCLLQKKKYMKGLEQGKNPPDERTM